MADARALSVASDDDVIGDMDTPLDENAIPPADLGDDDNNDNNNITEDLIPAADFADNNDDDNNNNNNNNNDDNQQNNVDIEVSISANNDEDDNNNNNNNNNDNDDNNNEDDAAVTTQNNNDNNDDDDDNDNNDNNNNNNNGDEPAAAFGQAAMVNNMNVAIDNGTQQRDNDKLEVGSAFDATANDENDALANNGGDLVAGGDAAGGGGGAGMNIDHAGLLGIEHHTGRDGRGQSVINVEAVPMDAGGKDVHGPIPNLIAEIRFDLKLCFQGIEIDDSIVGPLIGLRPIIEQRIGQEFQELVRGVVNDNARILGLLTEYNEADTKFYNAAKWGSVGMLALFLIFGVYALIHLVVLKNADIAILIIILAVVIVIAFLLLTYMLRSRKKSKAKESEWRSAVLSELASEMKNLWAVAANVTDDDIDLNSDLPIVFSIYYPLHSNEHDKEEHEIQQSSQMVALRVSQGPIISLDKNVKSESMYDTTADGM